jgi:hypothetical protein
MRTSLLLATATILLSGCSVFETKKKAQKAIQIDESLTGRWSTDCFERGFIFTKYQREELTFSAVGDFEKKAVQHVGADCKTETVSKTVSGTYDELDPVPGIVGGKAINFTVRDVVFTAHTDEAVKSLNEVKTCGLSDWVLNKPTSVLGKKCGETFQDGAVIFDVYKRDGNTVYLGQSFLLFDDKDAPENRPTSLELDRPYRKQ